MVTVFFLGLQELDNVYRSTCTNYKFIVVTYSKQLQSQVNALRQTVQSPPAKTDWTGYTRTKNNDLLVKRPTDVIGEIRISA